MIRELLLVLVGGSILPGLARAEGISTFVGHDTFFSKTLQTFSMLAVVILLILGLSALLRRFISVRSTRNPYIKMTHVLSLGARERIVLLEVKDVNLVVGITASMINVLHVFPSVSKDGSQENL